MKTHATRQIAAAVLAATLVNSIWAVASQAAPAEPGAGPPFSFREQDGVDWLVKPDGEKFFSLGVCVVTMGATRADFSRTNPGYAAFLHYENSNRWAEATLRRLASWGFTTVGGWSDYAALRQCRDANVAFTPVLHVGSTAGVPWWDMWDTNIIARMHQVARDQILPLRNDPRLLGYYTDNEVGWWNSALFRMTLEQKPGSGQRQRLIGLLRETYHGDWQELAKDFEAEGVGSFAQLDSGGKLYLRPGGNGIRVCRRFLRMMAERYYALVREVVRTYDQRGLVLGDRYQSFYYPEVARAAAPHVDAISANLNTGWNDGKLARYYLDTLHALTGKPVFVSEFYMAARRNRSGNRNDSGTFPTVTTQKERAAGFRNTALALLRTPYVVGADWFQFFDEPTYGRGDGENFNFGLVDIHGRPYELLTAAAAALDPMAVKSRPPARRADASLGVPPAPRDPLANFTITRALESWDRERGFVTAASEFPVADLYLCWDKRAVYAGLYAQDIVEADFYRGKTVPDIDRAEWIVTVAGAPDPIRVRLGPGAPTQRTEFAVQVVDLSGIYLNTRNIAAMALPAKLFGRDRFREGDTVDLAATLYTHCRADRVEWRGKFTLRGNASVNAGGAGTASSPRPPAILPTGTRSSPPLRSPRFN